VSNTHFRPLRGHVFVSDLEGGMRQTTGGIFLADDDMKDHGIRQRWAKIAYLGEGVTDLKVDEWVLLPHGRWTNKLSIKAADGTKQHVWRADYDAILLVSEERPSDLSTRV
jgi:co-chaperonin GroES (HSP10)